eukprot:TRINITY_DN9380_c0_g1_i1.p1 TRINITY_DN9380_c0_g1~~TRINITY_DN9380_c0_g1_i1.p1  ORF type:complete len:598 (+),score=69.82 TRINITY_DN9380_c0_g1_i1:27-1820(+)
MWALLVLVGLAVCSHGAKLTWTGASSTNPQDWGDGQNWNPAQVPGSGDDVLIPGSAEVVAALAPVMVNSITLKDQATLRITAVNATVGTLFVNDTSTLSFAGGTATAKVTNGYISASLSFASGTASGAWVILQSGKINFPNPQGEKLWAAATVTNYGVLNIDNAFVSMTGGTQIVNKGTVTFFGGAHLSGDSSSLFSSSGQCVIEKGQNPGDLVQIDGPTNISPLNVQAGGRAEFTYAGTAKAITLGDSAILIAAAKGTQLQDVTGPNAILAFNESADLLGTINVGRMELSLPGDASVNFKTAVTVTGTTAIYSGGISASGTGSLVSVTLDVSSSLFSVTGGQINATTLLANSDSATLTGTEINVAGNLRVFGRTATWNLMRTTIILPEQASLSVETPWTLTAPQSDSTIFINSAVNVGFPTTGDDAKWLFNQMTVKGNSTYTIQNGTLSFGVATFSCYTVHLVTQLSRIEGQVGIVNWQRVEGDGLATLQLTIGNFHIDCGTFCGALASAEATPFSVAWVPPAPKPPAPPTPPIPTRIPTVTPVPSPTPPSSPPTPPSPNVAVIVGSSAGSFVGGLAIGGAIAYFFFRRTTFQPVN